MKNVKILKIFKIIKIIDLKNKLSVINNIEIEIIIGYSTCFDLEVVIVIVRYLLE